MVYTGLQTQAYHSFGSTPLSLHPILMKLAAASTACHQKDTARAIQALRQLQDTVHLEQSQDAAEVFCLYRALAYLVKLEAWEATTLILDALLDACLQELAAAKSDWPTQAPS